MSLNVNKAHHAVKSAKLEVTSAAMDEDTLKTVMKALKVDNEEDLEVVAQAVSVTMNVVQISKEFGVSMVIASKIIKHFRLDVEGRRAATRKKAAPKKTRSSVDETTIPLKKLTRAELDILKAVRRGKAKLSENFTDYLSSSNKRKSAERKYFLAKAKKSLLSNSFPLGKVNKKGLKKDSKAEEAFDKVDIFNIYAFIILLTIQGIRCIQTVEDITAWAKQRCLAYRDESELDAENRAHFLSTKGESKYTEEQTKQHLDLYMDEAIRKDMLSIINQVTCTV